jgi:hypothetical protein
MTKLPEQKIEEIIVTKTGNILSTRKNHDKEAALKLWQELDAFVSCKRNSLSPKVLDLVLQLEFFMEEHPETEWNDVVNAYYLAKKSLLEA